MTILRKINHFMEDLYLAGILKNEGNYRVHYWETDSIENCTTVVILEIYFCKSERDFFKGTVEQVKIALNDEFPSEVILNFLPDIRGCIEIWFKRQVL